MRSCQRLVLAAILLCAGSLVAQVTPVKGAGCPGSTPPKASGKAQLGRSLLLTCSSCTRSSAGFVAIGIPSEPSERLSGAPLCLSGITCVLVVEALHLAIDTSSFRLEVPNVADLAGLGFRVQCGCFDRAGGCITLGGAVDVVLQR